ncbi:LOW QUALITY PROTEIN: dihydrolipoyllysine-residue acetyltransferase component of pyruvate dehydrogenase complex [Neodiprion lecontei]|uniref:Dihydrolipoamide acetyltransferase component of pyruvate dehydrogenase complex n=1 Tax=Neodiprion lecontei TaxID=441921 RepID=A0ABM3GGL0_NEOLC|nr:LOW QUALITY PROTEIN: dihydrolipoyllysine-residue acetyltransferase component of pyruvate dehydrogenase complex [Neodiprion lecontei]
MAQVLRGRVGVFTTKYFQTIIPKVELPIKYHRSCFHTSWVFDVKGRELLMPSLSPTMEQGTLIKWLKKEGDDIDPGDAVADIQTDKAVMTMEMDDEAILAKIIVAEGTKDVKVGTLIALTVDKGEDWKAVEVPGGSTAGTPSVFSTNSDPPAPSAPAASASQPIPDGQHDLTMPALSPTMTTGVLVKWLKKEGDNIEPGDAIADIQTDKAVMTFELEDELVLAKIIVPEGSQVEVGQLIALTMDKGSDWTKAVIPATTPVANAAKPAPSTPSQPLKPAPTSRSTLPPPSGQVYGLAVKRLLEEYDLSSGSIKGTGRPNRLLKSDVLAHIQAHGLQKVAPKIAIQVQSEIPVKDHLDWGKIPSTYKDVPVSNIRAVIAKRLAESKRNIPHSYEFMDIKVDKLNEIREKLKAENVKVSVNDFITKAVAHALLECPAVNTLYQNGQIVQMQKVDISFAVSIPTGLITPIIFDVPSKGLIDISASIKELAGRARDGKLQPHEFQGGTFTISNLGMFGIKEFSAIINPPQTAILAVGTGRQELDSNFNTVTRMTTTLSYDRRAIDDDQAADFLAVLRAMLEDPTFLAVGRAQAYRHKRV